MRGKNRSFSRSLSGSIIEVTGVMVGVVVVVIFAAVINVVGVVRGLIDSVNVTGIAEVKYTS